MTELDHPPWLKIRWQKKYIILISYCDSYYYRCQIVDFVPAYLSVNTNASYDLYIVSNFYFILLVTLHKPKQFKKLLIRNSFIIPDLRVKNNKKLFTDWIRADNPWLTTYLKHVKAWLFFFFQDPPRKFKNSTVKPPLMGIINWDMQGEVSP